MDGDSSCDSTTVSYSRGPSAAHDAEKESTEDEADVSVAEQEDDLRVREPARKRTA